MAILSNIFHGIVESLRKGADDLVADKHLAADGMAGNEKDGFCCFDSYIIIRIAQQSLQARYDANIQGFLCPFRPFRNEEGSFKEKKASLSKSILQQAEVKQV